MQVHTLWIGDRLPLLQQVALKSWLHFGHQVSLFTYEKVADIPAGVTVLDGESLVNRQHIVRYKHGKDKGSPSLFANIFRYKFLYEAGGCWIDCDTACLVSVLPTGECVISSESKKINDPSPGHPNLAYVYVVPGTDLMRRCYELAKNNRESAWGSTGPKLLAAQLKLYDGRSEILPARAFCPLPYAAAARIYSLPKYVPPRNCVGIHLWNQTLHRGGISNNKRGSEGSFFAGLCDAVGA